jgi:hypothetical protein
MKNRLPGKILLIASLLFVATGLGAKELIYLDDQGVVRWNSNNKEVALFGANYSLASGCDYRAAGYVHSDRKKLVEKDMEHFARMGWDGMRLCFWGDWENCDRQGNLILNDHLDVLDYTIYQAKQRGVYILFTPITTYASWWPDGSPNDFNPGFSAIYQRDQLGFNPNAIAAESNYLRQILNHVNPYTGVALKDEPNILFIEPINEPVHRPDDLSCSIAYIDALANAVRRTGCKKLIFYNVSQDFRITPAIKASKAQGVTFAWYPTGLNSGHMHTDNYLRSVDDFTPMLRPDLLNIPKLVYEFDTADMYSGFMYPAMVRAFRGVGAQFIAMFSYDMLDTAPYNLGWQTHFLNLVYSPKKAMSAIIAAEVARTIPRYAHYGDYPDNTRFGPFRVSYEQDSSEMVTDEKFLYANNTTTRPPNPAALEQIAGFGSSPVVNYEGCGAYFFDKITNGIWRLEIFPDAVLVQDPFAQQMDYQTVSSRLVSRKWPMTVHLPDLGSSFKVTALNSGNDFSTTASGGNFEIKPGVYLLSKKHQPDLCELPERVGEIGLTEFICPAPPDLPVQLLPVLHDQYASDRPSVIVADVIDANPPQSVKLYAGVTNEEHFREFSMLPKRGYRFEAEIPPGTFSAGTFEYYFSVKTNGATARFPAGENKFYCSHLVSRTSALLLFDATHDGDKLAYTRIGDNIRYGIFKHLPTTTNDPDALRLFFPLSYDPSLDDYTASLTIKDKIADRGSRIGMARALHIMARGMGAGQRIYVTLVESDGTSWGTRLTLSSDWQDIAIPIEQLQITRGVQLPLGFPGRWDYWLTPAKGRGGSDDHPHLEAVEHLQVSFRPPAPKSTTDTWVDIASVSLTF